MLHFIGLCVVIFVGDLVFQGCRESLRNKWRNRNRKNEE